MTFKYSKQIDLILKFIIVFAFVVFSIYFLNRPAGVGDESLFLNDLQFLKENSWFDAIAKKMSITYLILAYPLSFLFSDFLALRILNIILFLLLILYFVKIGEIKNKMFYFYFLFYSSNGWFLLGTNDTLFIVSLCIFFNESYKIIEEKNNQSSLLLWISLLIALFTRALFYVYIPIIIFIFFLIIKSESSIFKKITIPVCCLVLLIALNLPSILVNNWPSYDNKLQPKNIKSNWSQRQYLAQLLVNSGNLADEQHQSWQETDEYLDKNGDNSLPRTVIESIFFDYKLTIKEFFKDFYKVAFQSIRQTGLIILVLLSFLFYNVFKKNITSNLLIPFCVFSMIAIFSLIIISFVETRWLTPIYIAGIVYYSDLERNKSINKNIFFINKLVTVLVLFFGLYKLYLKI